MEKTIKESYVNSDFGSTKIDYFEGFKILEAFPAKGGEADIFRCEDQSGRYILKLYRYGIEPPMEIMKKIEELSKRFSHDLVLTIKQGYSLEHRRYYEILEEARFGNLREFLKGGKVTDYQIKDIIKQVVDGLEVLQTVGILHLDLKPENILIRKDKPFDLILSDFGMASLFDKEFSKKMTSIKGTDTYWSPESSAGFATEKSDYWSLGIIIYEILIGEHPYRHLSSKLRNYELNVKDINIPENIKDEYKNLLKGLLTKNPDKRWGIGEITRWLGGERVEEYFESSQSSNNRISLKYRNQDFYTLEELSEFLAKEANGRDELKKLFLRGHISTWYSRQGLIDEAMEIDDLRESGKKEAFDLFLKKYCPQFNPNSFADFLSKINIERIKYEFSKLKRSRRLPLVIIGLAIAFGTGAWIPITVLVIIFYFKGSSKSSNIGAKIKKEINLDELKNIGREIRDEFKKEFTSGTSKKSKTDKDWEAEKKREIERIREEEIARIRKKRRRRKAFRLFLVIGGVIYLAVNNPNFFPSFVSNFAFKIQEMFVNIIQPIFWKVVETVKEIINNF